MSDTQYAEIGDTVYFHFAANDTSGSGGDGASAAADVRECGAAASDAPIHSPTPSLLSHANYPAGCYEVAVECSTGNGFADLTTYAVFSTLAIDSQNPSGFIGRVALGKLATQKDLGIMIETTIATVSSQTNFTLAAGSDQDNQYQYKLTAILDADDPNRYETVLPNSYTGSSRTMVLNQGTQTFTAAVGDKVIVFATIHPTRLASATAVEDIETDTQNIQSRLPAALSANGNLNVNVEEVNNVQVQGSGVEDTDEWRPA